MTAPKMESEAPLSFYSIRAIQHLYRSRQASPVEVVGSCLARIRSYDQWINAWITVLEDDAMDLARRHEADLMASSDRPSLHGIPIGVKDNIDTGGIRTTAGSPIRANHIPKVDARVVENLKAKGAIVLGKTNLLEFAYGVVHPTFGQCNNPWDLTRTAGGSSSGSAAAVAAGFSLGCLGTDTGGSIRIPASYCGVIGLKPTYDRVSRHGVFPLAWSLDHVGPIARTADDASILLEAMQEPTKESRPPLVSPTGVSALRIGVLREQLGDDIELDVQLAFERAVGAIREAGAAVREISIPSVIHSDEALMAILLPEATSTHERWLRSRANEYATMTRSQLELGALVLATDYLRAQRFRARLRADLSRAFRDFDLLMSPTVAWGAPKEDPAIADSSGTIEMRRSAPYNLTGLPAVTVPMALGEGSVPLGIQFVGPWMSDQWLLSIASQYESICGLIDQHPPDSILSEAGAP